MNITKKIFAFAGATLIAASALAAEPSITLKRVQQRYPWNGKVDIDYQVENVENPNDYFVRFTVTTKEGKTYAMHEFADAATLINASNGAYRVTWIASADETKEVIFTDNVKFFAKGADVKAELVFSGSNKSQVPYPYYMVIDISGGSTATSYPVAYECFANTAAAVAKYNTDEYKTGKIVLRRIHPCTFMMGSPEDEVGRSSNEVQREVTLSETYYIGLFTITKKQWVNVMGGDLDEAESKLPKGGAKSKSNIYQEIRGNAKYTADVTQSSFLGLLRDRSGLTDLDLPTEAQWECACRAGTTTSTFFGNNQPLNYMWVGENTNWNADPLQNVGGKGKLPNQWGLYDMLGNGWEICLDIVFANNEYSSDPVTDPFVGNGGRYVFRSLSPAYGYQYHRSAARMIYEYTTVGPEYGFRLSRHSRITESRP